MRVRDVRRTDVVCVIQGYISNGRRTADQLRSQLRSLFSYAVELGYIEHNPAAEISTRVTGYTYKPRERVLTDAEIKHIWHEQHGHARLMRFLLLTGVRIGEARNGQPHDAIDNIWTIPAEISKNGRAHRVQLSDTANEQLSAPWVASGTAAQAWVKRYCFRHEIEPAWTPHDLRRTCATRLNELGTSPHVVERCLNHTMQGVMAVYNRAEYHDERLKSYKLIESHVLEVVSK
jgi:integrase